MLFWAFFGFSDLDAFVDNTALFRRSLRFAVSDGCQLFHLESDLAWGRRTTDTMFVPSVR